MEIKEDKAEEEVEEALEVALAFLTYSHSKFVSSAWHVEANFQENVNEFI